MAVLREEQAISYLRLVARAQELAEEEEETKYSEDPIGYSLYLRSLLKRGLDSRRRADLLAWARTFVVDIIQRERTTRFIEEEVTASVFLWRVLQEYDGVKPLVESRDVGAFAESFYNDRHCFFDNLAYSAAILWALAKCQEDMKHYRDGLDWIMSRAKAGRAYGNPVTVLFVAELLSDLGLDERLRSLVAEITHLLFGADGLRMYDRVYLCDIAWKHRELLETSDVERLTERVQEALVSSEIELKKSRPLSRIYLSVLVHLASRFSQDLLQIQRQELEKKYASRGLFLGAGGLLIGGLPLAAGIAFLYLLGLKGLFDPANYTLAYGLGYFARDISFTALLVFVAVELVVLGGLVIYNVLLLGQQSERIVWENLIAQLRKFTKWWFFGVAGFVVVELLGNAIVELVRK